MGACFLGSVKKKKRERERKIIWNEARFFFRNTKPNFAETAEKASNIERGGFKV